MELFADSLTGNLARYAPVLLPVALGFIAVYWLLPQVRRSRPIFGGLAGGLALVLAGWLLVRHETVLPERILFYAFSALALAGAGLMLGQSNPVHAALSFALVVLSTCGLFLLLAAPFLMAATIIVYAGAIVVTFLFVIMLAQQAGLTSADQRSREPFLASLAGMILAGTLLCVLEKTLDARPLDAALDRVEKLARAGSIEEARRLLEASPGKVPGQGTLPIIEKFKKTFPGFDNAELDNAEEWLLNARDLPKLQKLFGKLHDHGQNRRGRFGTLESPAPLPATPFSKGPGRATLPAQNVAGLGRTLFADYLLPVVLAGTLLLVASIGAIAIAARRTEGLR